MAFDESVIGSNDFDPRAATESLIRQVSDIPPGGPVDARTLTTRLARKLGQPVPPPPVESPTPLKSNERGPLDFSAQAAPPPPVDVTDTSLDFSPQAAPPPVDTPTTPATSLSDYPIEFGKGVLEGTKNLLGAAPLKGVAGAHIPTVVDPALLDDLGRAGTMTPKERAAVMGKVLTTVSDRGLQMDYNAALRRIAQGGDPSAEIAALKPKFDANNAAAAQPVTDQPLYKAGKAVEDFGKETLAPKPGFEPGKSWTRDIGSGAGSIVGGVALSMIPGIGPYAAGAAFTTAGSGEAVDNAVKGGATPQQTRQAALLGGVAGATDMVDTLLPMLGSTGKALGFIKRMGTAAVKGAMIEAGQEGVQQLMQNAIAKGIYKPDQDMFEDVPRSMAIAAILGGVAGGASAVRKPAPSAAAPSGPATAAPGAAPGGPAPSGPAPGPAPGGERSSPEDIADFVKKAKEGSPSPEPGPAPEPASMSEAERQQAYTAARESHDSASEAAILMSTGLSPMEIAAMDEQDRIDAVIRAARPTNSNAGSTAQAEQEAQPQAEAKPEPASHLEYAVLREYGYSAEDIENMSPAQRKRDVQDAYAGGIKPGEAMQKHKPPATSESDVGAGTREDPIKPTTADDVLRASEKVKPNPTQAQAEAENYQHGHIALEHLGLTGKNSISIETGVGGVRKGTDPGGKPWSVTMEHAAYGRIKGTKGADGQPLDIFVGPHPKSPHVFVVDQHHSGGGFDEHKILAGFNTPIDALHAYANSYTDKAKGRIGGVTAMTPDEFKAWLGGDTTKALKPPASEPVKAEAGGPAVTEVAPADGTPKETPTGPGAESGGSAPIMQNSGKSSARQPTQATKSDEPTSLLQFIASKGGLAPHPELDALDIGDHRAQIPGRKGFFGVVRPTGMSLDMMREAAEEAGYFRGESNKTSTIRQFLDAIDNEMRGQRHAAEGEEGKKNRRQRTSEAESSVAAREKAVAAARDDIAAEYAGLPDDLLDKAAEVMADESLDLDTAVETAAMRLVSEDSEYGVTPNDLADTFGESVIEAIRFKAPEKVKSAAIRINGTGEVFEAGIHAIAREGAIRAYEKNFKEPISNLDFMRLFRKGTSSGFVTTHGRFVSREEAIEIAKAHDQVKPDPVNKRSDYLLAEDTIYEAGVPNEIRPRQASEDGRAAAPAGDQERRSGEGQEAGKPGERVSDAGPERGQSQVEITEAGQQQVIPGAEKIGDGELAQRKADTGLKPTKPQKPADIGLFSDERDQGDLLNLPATRENLFVQIDGRKFPLTSYEDASRAYSEAIERTGATSSGRTGPQAPQPLITDDKGKVVGYISYNGRVWAGDPDNFSNETAKLLYDPRGEPDPYERIRQSNSVIELALGADADKVAPVDIARAAELMSENDDMDPATAFGQAVIETAVDQGFITEPEAIEAYGEKVKNVLDAGREGASGSGTHLEQGGAASGEVSAGGAAQTGVVPSSGEAGGQGEGGADSEGTIPATSGTTASGGEAIGDQASDTAADRSTTEGATKLVADEEKPILQAGDSNGIPPKLHAGDAPAGTEDVQPAQPGRDAAGVRGREGAGSEPDVRGPDQGRAEGEGRLSEGAAGERSDRSSDGGADRVSGSRADDATNGREKRAVERAANHVEGENFTIEPGALDEGRSPLKKARDNIAAIMVAQHVESEGRHATRTEQGMLARYVGWGGIKGAFPDADGKFAKGFESVGEQVRDLLDKTEYDTARRSIQYAHYTSETIVRSMWSAVARLGFKEGQVFEPGMGVGNFAGMMPTDIAANSQYVGLELDHTTARIAKLLYPKYGVRRDDFTTAPLPENNYDLIIGNPPFADIPVKSDPKYRQGFLLHDYFLAKSIDAVRPGGLLSFVTSAGTMNKGDPAARNYVADRADLVGAIRLPGDAFKQNAGTDVTTDILFFRKRLPGDIAGDRFWTDVVETTLPNRDGMKITGNVSSYFAKHPEMVLGEQGFFDKLYQNRYAVRSHPGADIKADLQKAIKGLPADVMSAWQDVNANHGEQDFLNMDKKDGTFYLHPNGLHQVVGGVGRPVGQRGKGVENGKTAAEIERISGLIPVRDSLRAVYAADLKGDIANGERAREALNKHYDAFVEKFGPINKAVIQTRRPNVIQMEAARAEAREEARYAGATFKEGSFDATPLLDAKMSLSVIARKRQEARDDYAKKYLNFEEGDFDPNDVPDVIIDKRPNVDPFMDDPESYRLRAIERYDEGSGKGYKSPVFFENVITRTREPEINSVNDAMLYSLSQYGRVNIPEMARLAKKSEGQVVEELGEQVFRQPGTSDVYQTRGEYLSGDVRKKLAIAQKAAEKNPDFRRNVAALEAAQPMPLAPSQIHATLGMPWIPVDVVQDFGKRELGLETLKVRYIPALAQWIVSGDTDSVAATSTWGTSDRRAPALLSDALNRQNPKIYDKYHDETGRERSILNVAKTEAAQDKIRAIQDKFRDWIWSDTERADRLAAHYNENYNNLVVREYDGDYLTTPGVASNWTWRPHQKRVIARGIQSGNLYIAHAVGAGKTSEYIGLVMEKRRLGLARKPMIVVPNHMLAQFTKEFYEQYPMARLAIADDRRFHTDRRKQFIANVATDDLDSIIITHSAFGMIPMSENFANAIIEAEINQYRELLAQVGGMGGGSESRITRSRIEKQIERLQQRLVGKAMRRRDQVFTFEEMGIDDLTIDEAHLFRKLDFSTNMSSLKGITPEGSGMSWDLYVKTRYLESIKPGRGLTLGSGTPITNTMAELFTVSRFMQPQVLADRGLEKFDAWAGAFGESVSELEQDAAGNYKPVSRFAKFVNVAELSAMVRQIMDVVTSKQLERYVTRPKIAGGKRKLHLSEKSPELERYQAMLAARMEKIQKRKGPPKKGDDIMLSVINDGRHAAIDMRLAGGSATSNIQSKLDDMIDNVFETWQRTKKTKFYKPAQGGGYETTPAFEGPATQLVFINLGLSGARGFSVPDHIRNELVRRGVPKDEIAYIYDYKSQTAKQRLFNDMNEGKKRIMMGSVAKMGIGTNVQRRLKAIHNQDALWYPSDDEQRNGRGLRQGNMNPELEINDYATKGTYDSTMWGMMEKKARFIQGFFEGDPSLREMDDLGEASQYEQAKALTTNDPRLIQFTELKQELERANRRKTAFDSDTYHTRQRRARSLSEAEHYTKRIAETERDIADRVDTAGDKFNAKIGKTEFTKRTEFGDALFEKLADVEAKGTLNGAIKVADVGGFPIYATTRKSLIDKKNSVDVYLMLFGGREREVSYGVSTLGTVRSIESILHNLDSDLEDYKSRKARAEKFYAESEKQANARFQGDAEIEALTEKVRALHAELSKPADRAAPQSQVAEQEEEPESARLAKVRLLPDHKHAAVEQAVRTFLQGILGSHVKVEFHKGVIQVSDQARAKWGGLAEGKGAVGTYNSTRKLVKLAMTDGIDRAAFHEAYHASRDLLMTPVELAFMDRQNAALRDWVQRERGYTDAEMRGLDNEEVEAIGAEEYMAERTEDLGQGLHIGVRRFFRRLMEHLRRLANAIRGLGYRSYNDIYADLFEGKHGEREARAGADDERASFGPGGGRRGPPPVSETIAQHLEDRNFNRLAKISRALGLGRINTTELRTQLQDKFIRVRDTERMVDPALPSSQSAYQAESLYYGRTGEQLEQLERDHFDPLITDMKARGIDLEGINEYLYARHAPERNLRMDEINHPDLDPGGRDLRGRGSGMSDDEALEVLDRITAEGKIADYEAVERRIRTILDNTRNGLVDSGLISQATADAWTAQYEFYVPLRGFEEGTEDETMSGRGAGFDTRARETQQAFGRLSKAAGPLPYIMQQAEMAIVRGEKNRVGNAWLRFVRSHPDAERWTVDTPPTKKAIDKRTGLVTTVQDAFWHLKPDIFVTKIGGKPVLIQMKGKDGENVVRALKNMGTSNLNSVLRFMNALTSTMSRLATQWNPNFTVPNFARDVGEAFINLQAQDQATFVKRFSKHLFPAIKGSFHALRGASGGTYGDAFREFDKAGGRIRFFGLENHDDVEKNINQRLRRLQGGAINNVRAAGEAAAHGFEIVNGAIENATRLAAFMAARDVGMSAPDAAMLARNLTVDFNKKGELGSAINALYMFANASAQGTARMASAMTHKRVRRAAYLLAVAGALGALANILGGGDDDDGETYYSKIKPYIRDKNLIIMWPKGFGHNGQYVKIPLPYGFSPFHVLGDRLAGVTLGKDKPGAAAWAVLASIADAFNPLGEESASMFSILPSVFRPAAHIQANVNWNGNPIYPTRDFEKNKPNSEQSFRSNSAFAKEAARDLNKATGGSPYKAGWVDWHPGSIDHTMESLTGGLGKFVRDVIFTGTGIYKGDPFDATKAPILRRFVGSVTDPAVTAASYYEAREQARKNGGDALKNARKDRARGINVPEAESFLNSNTNSTRGEQIFKSADKAMKPLRDRKERIEANTTLDAGDKRKQLDDITEQMRRIQIGARKQYFELSKGAASP